MVFSSFYRAPAPECRVPFTLCHVVEFLMEQHTEWESTTRIQRLSRWQILINYTFSSGPHEKIRRILFKLIVEKKVLSVALLTESIWEKIFTHNKSDWQYPVYFTKYIRQWTAIIPRIFNNLLPVKTLNDFTIETMR